MTENLEAVVRAHAAGIPSPAVFDLVRGPIPSCPAHGALVEVVLAAVDPAMRGWLNTDANYFNVSPGDVMPSHGIARILESRIDGWTRGDLVFGWFGWRRFAAAEAQDLMWRVDLAAAPIEAWLHLLGLNGLTAWLGLHHFAVPVAGETILVTTAAGGVGSIVGQLAREVGLRTVGLTSGAGKMVMAKRIFGYDEVIDYRARADLRAAICSAAPDGIDIFFDNVSGGIADAVFAHLNRGARIIQCGTASVPDWTSVPTSPRKDRDMLVKRLTWKGFVALDHAELFPSVSEILKRLLREHRLHGSYDILEGLAAAPGAIERLYKGENTGRLLIRP